MSRFETEKHRQEQITVPRGTGKTLTFVLKPAKVGHVTLKITAKCALAGDGIERQLLVEPEGLPQYINKALLVDLRSVKEIKQLFEVEIPEDAVPDSTKVEVFRKWFTFSSDIGDNDLTMSVSETVL